MAGLDCCGKSRLHRESIPGSPEVFFTVNLQLLAARLFIRFDRHRVGKMQVQKMKNVTRHGESDCRPLRNIQLPVRMITLKSNISDRYQLS
jgi:hypothetical protein